MSRQRSELSKSIVLAFAMIALIWFSLHLSPLLRATVAINHASIFVAKSIIAQDSNSGEGMNWLFRKTLITGTLLSVPCCSIVNPRLAFISGLEKLLRGQRQEAIQEMQCALEGSPKDPVVSFYLGAFYYPLSPEAAIQVWRNVPEIAVYLGRLGSTRYANGYLDEAVSLWTASHQIDPEPHWRKTQMYLGLCEIKEGRGDITEALYWCQLAELSNRDWPTMLAVGDHYLALRDYKGVEEIAHQLMARDSLPPHPRAYAHRLLARIYVNTGQNEAALAEYLQAIGISREPGLLLELGDLYMRIEDYALAISAFQEAMMLSSSEFIVQKAQEYIRYAEERIARPGPISPGK